MHLHAHPTAPSYLNHAYGGVGAAAASKERAKVIKYMQVATLRGFDFAPFGLESYGAWGPAANESLRRLCKHASTGGRTDTRAAVGWCAPHIAEVARQWVSVALQRGNGRLSYLCDGGHRWPPVDRSAWSAELKQHLPGRRRLRGPR